MIRALIPFSPVRMSSVEQFGSPEWRWRSLLDKDVAFGQLFLFADLAHQILAGRCAGGASHRRMGRIGPIGGVQAGENGGALRHV